MRKGTEIGTDAEFPRDEKTDRDLEAEISIAFAARDESAFGHRAHYRVGLPGEQG